MAFAGNVQSLSARWLVAPLVGRDWARAVERRGTLERCSVHDPAVRKVIVYRVVLGATIIPHCNRVWLPAPAYGELRPVHVMKQKPQKFVAFFLCESLNGGRKTFVDKKTILARLRMGSDHRMKHRRIGSHLFLVLV